jgi:ribonuclease HI
MMETENSQENWVRRRFKGNKVWVETDGGENPLVLDGRVRIKYRLDQEYEYRVYPEAIRPLDEPLSGTTQSRDAAGAAKKSRPKTSKKTAASSAAKTPTESDDAIFIYTDGASSGNPGPSGIGVVMRYGGHEKEISRYIGIGTNNIAELEAVRVALSEVKNPEIPVRIYTDSSYVLGVLTLGWKAKKNVDLIRSIQKLMGKFRDIGLIKIRGHAGDEGNERADRLAVSAVQSRGDK